LRIEKNEWFFIVQTFIKMNGFFSVVNKVAVAREDGSTFMQPQYNASSKISTTNIVDLVAVMSKEQPFDLRSLDGL
jgi:hypothetical protein